MKYVTEKLLKERLVPNNSKNRVILDQDEKLINEILDNGNYLFYGQVTYKNTATITYEAWFYGGTTYYICQYIVGKRFLATVVQQFTEIPNREDIVVDITIKDNIMNYNGRQFEIIKEWEGETTEMKKEEMTEDKLQNVHDTVKLVEELCKPVEERKVNNVPPVPLKEVKQAIEELDENPLVLKHRDLCTLLNETYAKKNKAYGNSFGDTFSKLGIISAATRISDKYDRFVNLATSKEEIDTFDESIKDTLLDMANYCLMTVMELDQ